MSRTANAVADCLVDYIQRKGKESKEGSPRDVYALEMSRNQWGNRGFDELVRLIDNNLNAFGDRFERKGDRLDDWLPEAVKCAVDGHFSMTVLRDERLSRSLDDRTYNEMQDAKDVFIELVEPRRDSGRRDTGSGYGRDDRDERRPVAGISSLVARPVSEATSTTVNPAMMSREERERYEREEPAQAAPVHQPEPVREERYQREVARPAVNGPDYTKPRSHDDFWMDGEHWQVARLSKWTKNYDPNLDDDVPVIPAPSFHDVRRVLLYFVMDSQKRVREEFVDVNEDNRYLAHEALNDPKLNSAFLQVDTIRRRTAISLSAKNKPTDEPVQEVKPVQYELAEALAKTSKPEHMQDISVDSLAAAVFSARHAAQQQGTAVVRRYLQRTPILVKDFGQYALLDKLSAAENLVAVEKILNDQKGEFDQNLWAVINNRLSTAVLRTTRFQWQIGALKAINFAGNFSAFIAQLSSSGLLDPTALNNYSRRIRTASEQALGHVTREDVNEHLADLLSEGNEVPAVSFVDFVYVLAMPISLDGLGLGGQLREAETGVSVTPSSNNRLFRELSSLYSSLRDQHGDAPDFRLLISTDDNNLVEVLPYTGKTDTFILVLLQQ